MVVDVSVIYVVGLAKRKKRQGLITSPGCDLVLQKRLGEEVDMDVYICFCCGYPIIFRGRPPQVYHLGTGWPCWNMQRAGLCRPGLFPNLKFPSVTPREESEKLLKKAKELYDKYVSSDDTLSILDFINDLLEANRGDCVRDLLAHVASEGGKKDNALVRRVVASKAWQGYTCRLRIEQLYRDYLDTGDTSLILRFMEVQSKSNRRDCVRELLAYLEKQGDERADYLLRRIATSGVERRLTSG